MKATYDPTVDALYLQVQKKPVKKTVNPSEYCFVDLDMRGEVVGIEMLFASKRKLVDKNGGIKIEKLLITA